MVKLNQAILNKNSLKKLFAPSLLPLLRKDKNIHKYTNSICIALVGSEKFPGAGFLTLNAIQAAGAGYTLALQSSRAFCNFWVKQPSTVGFEQENIEHLFLKYSHQKNFSVVCGCGFEENNPLVEKVLSFTSLANFKGTAIWDGGAFSVLKNNFLLLKKTQKQRNILTPHLGEFEKLFPDLHARLKQGTFSKQEACYFAAQESGCIIILKGPQTVIAAPSHVNVFVNLRSTPALAKAGTGDILAGLIAGICAHGIEPLAAACFSVYLHSQLALTLEKKYGFFAVTPERMLKNLSFFLYKRLGHILNLSQTN